MQANHFSRREFSVAMRDLFEARVLAAGGKIILAGHPIRGIRAGSVGEI